jgi:outer membrane protein OmpA-like peptidoglycan-associated protein
VPNRVEQVAIPAPVAELVAAWNDRSADRFVAVMAPDVHVDVPPLHLELNGRDDVWVGVARLFASFGALRYTYRHRYLTQDTVTDEALLEGLQTQEFLGAPPTGRPGGVAARVMMQHDGLVITGLEVWPDIAALRDLTDGVARRIDLRSAGPAAPIVAALRATIPATEVKLSVAQERQPSAPVVDATLLPGAPERPARSGGSAGAGSSDAVEHGKEHSKGKPKVEVPKAPVPRRIRRLRGLLAGLVMLAVAGLLVTYVVTGVRNKGVVDALASKPSPTSRATRSTSAKPRPRPSPTPGASRTTPAAAPTLNPVTNTYSFTNKVLFEQNKSTLRSQARRQLDQVITALKAQKRFGIIVVTGYTDDTGTPAYNLVLSRRRARVVQQYLTANLGDSRFPVRFQGWGATGFVADNTTEAGREQNRRVEIKVPEPTTGQ